MKILDDIEQLRSHKGVHNYIINVGVDNYIWDENSTGIDDGVNILEVSNYVGPGRWIKIETATKEYVDNFRKVPVEITTDKSVTQADNRTLQYSTVAVTVTIVVNDTEPTLLGTQIDFFQAGAGAITFAAGLGVTIISENGVMATSAQGKAATLIKLFANTWALII